jgi:hypothetical protein
LAEVIEALAAEFGATLAQQRSVWYGFDRIHYKLRVWRQAWAEVLKGWALPAEAGQIARHGLAQWLYLRSRMPYVRWLFGREQWRPQPAGHLADGSRIFVY